MDYIIVFIEGIVAFISPCILPMLPMYISYFAGKKKEEKKNALINSIGFVIGFTIIFVLLGVFASTLGYFVRKYIKIINIIFGISIILLGLNFMDILKIPFINNTKGIKYKAKNLNFLKSILFGIMFSVAWTPCIGTFLGTALMMVANNGEIIKGMIMLFLFSIGLGIPFIISAILLEKIKSTFDFIKRNYKIINIISGIILIITGILIMTDLINYIL